ncbi:MAG: translation initiation factor IF-2 subunit alpha [archaeon]|jgi:translation initiation factor 2 subunit 1|nr:translation initiation factor IF-2 subunit alpha [archaeon]
MATEKRAQKFPEEGEFAMGIVSKIFPYGVFVKLTDYNGVEGMVHVSEVSNKWVKNIKDHVKDKQVIVVKVLRVSTGKGHVDLSIKSVKDVHRKKILDSHKRKQRVEKLLAISEKEIKRESAADVMEALEDGYKEAYSALEAILSDGGEALEGIKLSDEWKKELVKLSNDNIELPVVSIKAILKLESEDGKGVETIKSAVKKARKANDDKEVNLELKYKGAPHYSIRLTGPDYKKIEKIMEKVSSAAIDEMKGNGGSGQLIRE